MAQIESGGGNGKGKCHQKKMTIRVDFTPMVDMNMLLITFFMLCTTMIKTQTISIALPSNKKLDQSQMNQASTDDALTIIIDAKRLASNPNVADTTNGRQPVFYYYEGKPDEVKVKDQGIKIIDANDVVTLFNGKEKIQYSQNDPKLGVRKILEKKNEETIKLVNAQKERFKKGEINDSVFNLEVSKILKDVEGKISSKPVVIIKATDQAPYGALVSVLDEMQINNIARYQIDLLNHKDSVLLKDYIKRHPNGN